MSLIFYHSVESTCAQKVRIVMARKLLSWREERLNLRRGDQFNPDYLKLNPNAVVPTLVHDDVVVRESTVINEYLEDIVPSPSLRPERPVDAARMRLIVKRIDEAVHGAIGVLSYAIFLRHQMSERLSPDELAQHFARVADPARRARQQNTHERGLDSPGAANALNALRDFVGVLSASLADRAWLVGDQFSLADAAAIPYLFRARALHLDGLWAAHDNVEAWLNRGIGFVDQLDLDDPFGSVSFHELVAAYAQKSHDLVIRMID